jgi:protein-S-isoprenylcysteine O-methyltransferase Ste14
METHRLVIMAACCVLGLSTIILGAGISRTGISMLGKPAIDKYFFYSGKLSLVLSLLLLLSKAIFPGMGLIAVPPALSLVAAILFCAGAILFIFAFAGLGSSLRVGIPGEDTSLRTTGIYRFSRNPMYVSIFIMCAASVLYYPNQVNLVLMLYGIFVHHWIILAEEKFLAEKFGRQWEEYRQKVRRYI